MAFHATACPMTARRADLRILVCGNADRGDDGAALAAITLLLPVLPDELRERIEVRRRAVLDVTDLIDVDGGQSCVVVDTVSGIEDGRIVTMTLDDLAHRPSGVVPRSWHALSVDDALLIVEAVRGTLPIGAFVGIGGKWFGSGTQFSRVVKTNLPAFAAAIRTSIEELLATASGA